MYCDLVHFPDITRLCSRFHWLDKNRFITCCPRTSRGSLTSFRAPNKSLRLYSKRVPYWASLIRDSFFFMRSSKDSIIAVSVCSVAWQITPNSSLKRRIFIISLPRARNPGPCWVPCPGSRQAASKCWRSVFSRGWVLFQALMVAARIQILMVEGWRAPFSCQLSGGVHSQVLKTPIVCDMASP